MDEDREATLQAVVLLANRWFRYHVVAFVVGNLALSGLNRLTSEAWWAFWPLFFWGLLLAVHFFLIRSFRADDGWADARARRLRAQAYDHGHIAQIERSYRQGAMPGQHDLTPPDEAPPSRPRD